MNHLQGIPPNKVQIVIIKNPFNPLQDREIISANFSPNKTTKEYLTPYLFGSSEFSFSLNGTILEDENVIVEQGDCLAVVPNVGKGGGKNILRSIAMLALTMYAGGLAGANSWATAAYGSFGSSMLAMGVMFVGGMLIDTMFPIQADTDSYSDSSSDSSYGFSTPSNYTSQGNALPKTFGTMLTAGQVLTQHRINDGDKQYLTLVLSGGSGPIDSISNIKIDDNPISNYENVQYETRTGANIQAPFVNVPSTYSDQNLNFELDADWSTQLVEGNAAEALEITLAFPNGLYYVKDDGSKEATWVKVQAEYREVGGTWISWFSSSGKDVTQSDLEYSILNKENMKSGSYSINARLDLTTDSYIVSVSDGSSFSTLEFDWNGLHIKIPANKVSSGSIFSLSKFNITISEVGSGYISSNSSGALYKSYTVNGLTSGKQYEVRVKCYEKAGSTSRFVNTVYFGQLSSIIYDKFTRPGKALIAIKALATDQLSGSMPKITWVQTRSKVKVWNPEINSYVDKNASNPAWAAYDILHGCSYIQNPNTGRYEYVVTGCKKERIDYYAFKYWADFCNEKKLTFNYIYETSMDMWKAVSYPEACGRGKVLMRGTSFTCVCDKYASPVQLFSTRNIYKDTFKETFLSLKDRANYAEVTFMNKDKNYEKDVVAAYADSYDEITTQVNSTSMTLYGCTDRNIAWREGKYRLLLNKYLTRTVEFEVDVDAIACQVGDSILIQHDLPRWGQSAFVVSATLSTVTLDEEVILEAGNSYGLMIRRNATDVLIEKAVVTPSEDITTNTLTFTVPFTTEDSILQEGDLVSFGRIDKIAKPFTVLTITRAQDMRRKITALEYNEAIYAEIENPPIIQYPERTKAKVTTLTLNEDGYTTSDGVRINNLLINWTLANPEREYVRTELQVAKNGGEYTTVATTNNLTYDLNGVATGTTYTARARLISLEGIPLTAWKVSGELFVTGSKDFVPPAPSDLVVAQRNSKVVISCTPPSIPDYNHIEIRMDGADWNTAKFIVSAKNFQVELDGLTDGTHIFRAKTVDNVGQYSQDSATFITTLSGVMSFKNIILEREDVSAENEANLTLDNLVYIGGSLKAKSSLLYSDVTTYEALPIMAYTETKNYIEITSDVIDTFKVGLTGVTFDFNWLANTSSITYGSISGRTYGDYPQDKYGNVTMKSIASISIALSNDGNEFSDWQPYIAGQYIFRYIKYKFLLSYEGERTRVVIDKLKQYYDVPDISFRQTIEVPASATSVSFSDLGYDFYSKPEAYTQSIGGNGNVFCDITNLTADGLTLTCYNRTGTIVSGTILLVVNGY